MWPWLGWVWVPSLVARAGLGLGPLLVARAGLGPLACGQAIGVFSTDKVEMASGGRVPGGQCRHGNAGCCFFFIVIQRVALHGPVWRCGVERGKGRGN